MPRNRFQKRLPANLSIQVIGAEGENLGVMLGTEALAKANELQLDLVEIGATSNPPIYKIMDYGKHQYQLQKKLSESRKNQKQNIVKEIKLRPLIDQHDYQVKINKVTNFLTQQDSVKIIIRMRGRELSHKDLAVNLIERIKEDVQDYGQLVLNAKDSNFRIISALITPLSKKT